MNKLLEEHDEEHLFFCFVKTDFRWNFSPQTLKFLEEEYPGAFKFYESFKKDKKFKSLPILLKLFPDKEWRIEKLAGNPNINLEQLKLIIKQFPYIEEGESPDSPNYKRRQKFWDIIMGEKYAIEIYFSYNINATWAQFKKLKSGKFVPPYNYKNVNYFSSWEECKEFHKIYKQKFVAPFDLSREQIEEMINGNVFHLSLNYLLSSSKLGWNDILYFLRLKRFVKYTHDLQSIEPTESISQDYFPLTKVMYGVSKNPNVTFDSIKESMEIFLDLGEQFLLKERAKLFDYWFWYDVLRHKALNFVNIIELFNIINTQYGRESPVRQLFMGAFRNIVALNPNIGINEIKEILKVTKEGFSISLCPNITPGDVLKNKKLGWGLGLLHNPLILDSMIKGTKEGEELKKMFYEMFYEMIGGTFGRSIKNIEKHFYEYFSGYAELDYEYILKNIDKPWNWFYLGGNKNLK